MSEQSEISGESESRRMSELRAEKPEAGRSLSVDHSHLDRNQSEQVNSQSADAHVEMKVHADSQDRVTPSSEIRTPDIHWKILSADVRMSDEVSSDHPNAPYLIQESRFQGPVSGRYIQIGLECARRYGIPENFVRGNEIVIALSREELLWAEQFEAHVLKRAERYVRQGKTPAEAEVLGHADALASYVNPADADRARSIIARVRLARDLDAVSRGQQESEKISLDGALKKYSAEISKTTQSIYSKGALWKEALDRLTEFIQKPQANQAKNQVSSPMQPRPVITSDMNVSKNQSGVLTGNLSNPRQIEVSSGKPSFRSSLEKSASSERPQVRKSLPAQPAQAQSPMAPLSGERQVIPPRPVRTEQARMNKVNEPRMSFRERLQNWWKSTIGETPQPASRPNRAPLPSPVVSGGGQRKGVEGPSVQGGARAGGAESSASAGEAGVIPSLPEMKEMSALDPQAALKSIEIKGVARMAGFSSAGNPNPELNHYHGVNHDRMMIHDLGGGSFIAAVFDGVANDSTGSQYAVENFPRIIAEKRQKFAGSGNDRRVLAEAVFQLDRDARNARVGPFTMGGLYKGERGIVPVTVADSALYARGQDGFFYWHRMPIDHLVWSQLSEDQKQHLRDKGYDGVSPLNAISHMMNDDTPLTVEYLETHVGKEMTFGRGSVWCITTDGLGHTYNTDNQYVPGQSLVERGRNKSFRSLFELGRYASDNASAVLIEGM